MDNETDLKPIFDQIRSQKLLDQVVTNQELISVQAISHHGTHMASFLEKYMYQKERKTPGQTLINIVKLGSKDDLETKILIPDFAFYYPALVDIRADIIKM